MRSNATFKKLLLCMAALGLFLVTFVQADELSRRAANTTVTLVPQYDSIAPGSSFWIGIYVELDDQWHTYWLNPGDSGYPITMEWELPPGFEVSAPIWPYPHRLDVPPLTSYGYEGETLLLFKMTAPASLPEAEAVTVQARGSWLSCRIECVPGTGSFSLTLPVTTVSLKNARFEEIYARFRDAYPVENRQWRVRASATDQAYILDFSGSREEVSAIEFFPRETGIIDHAAPQGLSRKGGGYQLTVPMPSNAQSHAASVSGLAVVIPPDGKKYSFMIDAPLMDKGTLSAGSKEAIPLPVALLFAFLGGLILNVMPCVLPVLSIKVLSLVDNVQKKQEKTLFNAFMFTLGILVSFWFLAFFITVLKAAGQYVGWGFQFQSPVFVVFMAVLFFWLGLNLFGIFEVGTSLTRIENFVGNSFLLKNHFVNGILATVVATPCTAPFMGSALGFALLKPPIYAYLIFTFLGLGLAFPYLVLSAFPRFLKFVPRPGLWMLTLKKVFGFFFMATVVWLAWVLGAQRGGSAIMALCVGLLFVAVSAWIIGQWATVGKPNDVRWRARIIAIALFLAGFGWALKGTSAAPIDAADQSAKGRLTWLRYSPEIVEELLKDGKPVLIDFTAKWCLSCQVNDLVAFANPEVIDAILEKGLVTVKADWTNHDETITKGLASYGKNSVPVYVLYGAGAKEPVFLPEILTPGIVLEALNKI